MADEPLRLGTRGSALARAQAKLVSKALGGAELVVIKTSGDQGSNGPQAGGDKARFVREIERALLDGEVDLGVHSAKDLPSELPEGLELAGVPSKEDGRDAFVGTVSSLGEIPGGARIGTSSLRRRSQLLALRPDLEISELRGNVDTRLDRLDEGGFDGLVLAAAGLLRLGRAEEMSWAFDPAELCPAPGQGTLVLEARSDNRRAVVAAESVTDRGALGTLSAERALVAALDASCNTPLGAHATLETGGRMRLRSFAGLPDGSEWIRDEVTADASDPDAIAETAAERLLAAGAGDILERAERAAAAEQ